MVSCLMGDSTALASAIVRCCLNYFQVELRIRMENTDEETAAKILDSLVIAE